MSASTAEVDGHSFLVERYICAEDEAQRDNCSPFSQSRRLSFVDIKICFEKTKKETRVSRCWTVPINSSGLVSVPSTPRVIGWHPPKKLKHAKLEPGRPLTRCHQQFRSFVLIESMDGMKSDIFFEEGRTL